MTSTKCFPSTVLHCRGYDSIAGFPAARHSSKFVISEDCFCNDSKIVIFGISHGVVIQLSVSNSSISGTKNIKIIKIEIKIIGINTKFLFIVRYFLTLYILITTKRINLEK